MDLGDHLRRFQFYLLCPSRCLSAMGKWLELRKLAVSNIS